MRLTDLLAKPVVDGAGHHVGRVGDVLLEKTSDGGAPATYAIAGLRITSRRVANLYGYERPDAGGPAVVRWMFRRFHRGDVEIEWAEVDDVGSDAVRLRRELPAQR